MASDNCHICHRKIPQNQSFYEKDQTKVCLSCYQTTPKCSKCGMPSTTLQSAYGMNNLCKTCVDKYSSRKSETCYICQKKIWPDMSRYEDHGTSICQTCFKDAPQRCFFCGFPKTISSFPSESPYCEFCHTSLISKENGVQSFLTPLKSFLPYFKVSIPDQLEIIHTNWNLILGMQISDQVENIHSFSILMQNCYPIYYLKEKIYIPSLIPSIWVLPLLSIQISAAYYCNIYQLNHLKGNTPFHTYLQGWCHYIGYFTALRLKSSVVKTSLSKFPAYEHSGEFNKFLAMGEYRKPKELISHVTQTISQYHKRYMPI